jgi:hypothetical protein
MLPMATDRFGVVIFAEASQVTLEGQFRRSSVAGRSSSPAMG